jgi:hypothetical protein
MANPDSNARFLSYDSSKIDLGEKKSTKNNDKTAYHTAAEIASAAGVASSGFTYTEVAINSAEIKDLVSNRITLLAAPGANKYYEYKGILEFDHGTIAYTLSGGADDAIVVGSYANYSGTYIDPGIFTDGTDAFYIFTSNSPNDEFLDEATSATRSSSNSPNDEFLDEATSATRSSIHGYHTYMNDAVELYLWQDANDFAAGDGTALVKLWYKVHDKGTAL